MPDMGFSRHHDAQERAAYLAALQVDRPSTDEYGETRYHIVDWNGDWVGDSYPTPELAADAITQMRKEG